MADLKAPSPLKLTEYQELESIHLDVADNGGLIVTYSVYTPAKTKTESKWKEHKEIFDDCSKALFRIGELFKVKLQSHKNFKKLTVPCE